MAAVRGKYKSKTTLKWEEAKISIFPDATKAVAEKRKKFTEVWKKLDAMDIRFTLTYPAKVLFTWKGRKLLLKAIRKCYNSLTRRQKAWSDCG